MAKVKVRVLKATVGGKTEGETVMVDEHVADHLESIRYAVRVGAAKKEETKDESEDK